MRYMAVKSSKIDFVKILGLIFLCLVFLSIISFTFLSKYTKIRKLAEEGDALSKRIEDEKREIERLKEDLKALDDDPFYLEKVAREKLGTVKEDEVVIYIEE